MRSDQDEQSQQARLQRMENVRQHLAELKKRVGPLEELTPQEHDAFDAKFANSVRMKCWIEDEPPLQHSDSSAPPAAIQKQELMMNFNDGKRSWIHLNGWHRAFIVIVLIWVAFVYIYGNRLIDNRMRIVSVDYHLANELSRLKNIKTDDTEVFDRYAKFPYRTLVMPDGVLVTAHTAYTNEDVAKAYKQAQPIIESAKHVALVDYLIGAAKIYLLPLVALYLFGWSVAWIRRGFEEETGPEALADVQKNDSNPNVR
jgi:hypothetical protein